MTAPGPACLIEHPLVLEPGDLVDGFGFGDGDQGDEYVDAWAESTWPATLGDLADEEHPTRAYLDSRALLAVAVDTHLVPALSLPSSSYVRYVGGLHNPFELLLDNDHEYDDDPNHPLRPEVTAALQAPDVVVPPSEVARLCQVAYPARPLGWLRLYAITCALGTPLRGRIKPGPNPLLASTVFRVGTLVGAWSTVLTDDARGLAAELLAQADEDTLRSGRFLSTTEITDVLRVAQAAADPRPRPQRPPVPDLDHLLATLTAGLLPTRVPEPRRIAITPPGGGPDDPNISTPLEVPPPPPAAPPTRTRLATMADPAAPPATGLRW